MPLTCSAVNRLLPIAKMRPAFRGDALRMLGGLRSHPVTRAIRSDALGFDPPDWTAGRAALIRLARLRSNALMRVIADGSLRFELPPSWDCTRPALDRVFGIDRRHHFLHAAPLEWLQEVRLTEPQITKGFAHFLNADNRTTRTGRIRALLWALGSADSDLREARVTPEASANRKRIDLLIEWTNASSHRRGAVIEAKFEHHVTPGQLPRYRTALKHIERDYRCEVPDNKQERPLLFIVSPLRDDKVNRALRRQRKKDWRWMSWRSLLLAFDRALHQDHDDDAFRQFRRTHWDRSAG